jgi:Tfp pilus assembly protein PilE
MKNRKVICIFICGIPLLLALIACASLAETLQDAEKARAQAVIDYAAKTPEEFMQRVKAAWDKPNANIIEACKIITEVPLERFVATRYSLDHENTKRYIIDTSPEINPETPYSVACTLNYIRQNQSYDAVSLGFRGKARRDNPQRILCITISHVKTVLGEPDRMIFNRDGRYVSGFEFTYVNGERTMWFKFDGANGLKSSPDLFERNKNICALGFSYRKDH